MSQRQGIHKDQEVLDRERSEAKERAKSLREAEEKRKEELSKMREGSKEKLNVVIQKNAPKKTTSTFTSYQISILAVLGVVLFLSILNFLGEGNSSSSSNNVIDADKFASFNKENKGFKIAANEFFEGWSLSDAHSHFSGTTNNGKFDTCPELQIENLPKKFSSRQKHTHCLTPIYDQGKCASSFAFAISGMLANRYCILHEGNKKFDASPQVILACETKNGCQGGDLHAAAQIAKTKGLVNNICMPYNAERVDHCDQDRLKSCFRGHFKSLCSTKEVEQIKRNIYKNGPVASLIQLSNEFLVYTSGVYDAKKATPISGSSQAVKIIGWDTDANNEVYWTIENSWGPSWGISGLAKVKVGSDPLLENNVVIGTVEAEIKSYSS